ncbi:MAG: hypothetical protein VKI63_04865 [Cyanobium sp.]|nr:hypothetical protein [Cyanobium sp.]
MPAAVTSAAPGAGRTCGGRRRLLMLMWKALLISSAVTAQAQSLAAQEQRQAVALHCRLEAGPWRECQMIVDQVGALWSLRVGEERIDFRHDGRGQVRMQRGTRAWVPVEARWENDAALCWNGICAKGDLPLD